jgi:hypothetical protein
MSRRLGENVVHEPGGFRCVDCNGLVTWPPEALKGANERAHLAFLRLIQELHCGCDPANESDAVMELRVYVPRVSAAGVA